MILRNMFHKLILLITVGLLAGCGFNAEPPAVGEIKAQSTTITTGDKLPLTIDVSGADFKFEWSSLSGSLTDPTQPNVIYTAPDTPGPDTVTVKVKYAGGEIIKFINFDVVAPPPPPAPTATDTPAPVDAPTPTAAPSPIACNHPSVTKNLFPQLEGVNGQYPIYGPVNPSDPNFLCEAVYDFVHIPGSMAVHIKYGNVGTNFGWWGIATPNGYDASQHGQLCFWAYALAPNQAFRLKMKQTNGQEKGVVTTIDVANEWTPVCTSISKFTELGISVDKMDNINLGFEQPTGSSEIWIADFEFK